MQNGKTPISELSERHKANFWKNVNKDGPIHPYNPELGNCWLWRGCAPKGYGLITVNGKALRATRVSLSISGNTPPPELCVLHSCHIPRCVNPDHLRIGTHQENMDDKMRAGRHKTTHGEESSLAVLSEGDVVKISLLLKDGKTYAEIGRAFGITQHAIFRIAKGLNWKHLNLFTKGWSHKNARNERRLREDDEKGAVLKSGGWVMERLRRRPNINGWRSPATRERRGRLYDSTAQAIIAFKKKRSADGWESKDPKK